MAAQPYSSNGSPRKPPQLYSSLKQIPLSLFFIIWALLLYLVVLPSLPGNDAEEHISFTVRATSAALQHREHLSCPHIYHCFSHMHHAQADTSKVTIYGSTDFKHAHRPSHTGCMQGRVMQAKQRGWSSQRKLAYGKDPAQSHRMQSM